MTDKLIDYDEEDLLLMRNPEKVFLNRIQQSLHLTRVVLYCGKKFLADGVSFVTTSEITDKFHSPHAYSFQLLNLLVSADVLKKQKFQGEKKVRYLMKNKEKLERAVKIAKTNLQTEEIKNEVQP